VEGILLTKLDEYFDMLPSFPVFDTDVVVDVVVVVVVAVGSAALLLDPKVGLDDDNPTDANTSLLGVFGFDEESFDDDREFPPVLTCVGFLMPELG